LNYALEGGKVFVVWKDYSEQHSKENSKVLLLSHPSALSHSQDNIQKKIARQQELSGYSIDAGGVQHSKENSKAKRLWKRYLRTESYNIQKKNSKPVLSYRSTISTVGIAQHSKENSKRK